MKVMGASILVCIGIKIVHGDSINCGDSKYGINLYNSVKMETNRNK